MSFSTEQALDGWAAQAGRLWLFLDYDGTLVEFAPTPDAVRPEPPLIELLTRLSASPRLRLVILSGRSLGDLKELLPAPGIFLAGVYGIEVQTPSGEKLERADYTGIRPILKQLKSQWQKIIGESPGFFLEDKGWALALHARLAEGAEASHVIAAISRTLDEVWDSGQFRLFTGPGFLEIAPALAHKGKAVSFLFSSFPWPGALPVYIGDDDKDEEAFATIHSLGGVALSVSHPNGPHPPAQADYTLSSPEAVRRWLSKLL